MTIGAVMADMNNIEWFSSILAGENTAHVTAIRTTRVAGMTGDRTLVSWTRKKMS